VGDEKVRAGRVGFGRTVEYSVMTPERPLNRKAIQPGVLTSIRRTSHRSRQFPLPDPFFRGLTADTWIRRSEHVADIRRESGVRKNIVPQIGSAGVH